MFGTNEIIGKRFFQGAPADSVFVTSVFYTLQGEGPFSGRPCVFVRLAKCNLACSFCDTMFDVGQWMTYTELDSKIYEVVCDHWNKAGRVVPLWALPKAEAGKVPWTKYGFGLVVTGGEPLLQDAVVEFLARAAKDFTWVQVESNGTVEQNLDKQVTLVVSPKCAEKTGYATRYLKPSDWMLDRADCLKFVVCGPPVNNLSLFIDHQTSPYESVPDWAHEWAKTTGKPVYVSPMNVYLDKPKKMRLVQGVEDKSLDLRSTADEVVSFWEPGVLDRQANQVNHEYAARYALEHGFRFQVQTHLYAGLA